MAGKSSVVVRFLGDTMSLEAAAKRAAASMETVATKGQRLSGALNTMGTAGIVAIGAIGVSAVKMGVDWQKSMTTLQTGAGETKANIKLVSDGLLQMAGTVGTSATELASGMYMVESAGYHGAAGLKVLQAAAEGAKVGNADMATVANAVTSALNSYHLKASDAASVTNTLIATVAAGKMKMDDLASALGNVLPVASVAGISLKEVGAALATMTSKGVDANTAATYLRQTISKLQAPTKQQADEMVSLGLSAEDVSSKMGKRGLAATLELLTGAITKKMGPDGLVMIEHLKKLAAHTTNFQKALIQLPPTEQTYVAALSAMMGGTKTLQGALLLTGDSMGTFKKNTVDIGNAVKEGGKNIRGWSEVTADLGTQIDMVREGAKAWLTQLGTQLIPVIEKVIGFVKEHADTAKTLATVIAGLIAFTIAWRVATFALSGVSAVFNLLKSGYGLVANEAVVNAAKTTAAWVASAATSAAAWVASTAETIAIGAMLAMDWIAEQVAMAAASVAAGLAAAAGWIVANIAMIAATGGILLAIGAIVLGALWLKDHWSQVWAKIKEWAAAAWNWIKDHWQLILTILIGPLGLAISWIVKNWGKVTAFFGTVIDGIKSAFSNVVNFITAPFRTAFNMVADLWNGTIGKMSFNLGPVHINAPQIPHLASGGIVTRPTIALIGEAGPEAVVPLSRGRDRIAATGGRSGGDIHIHVNGIVAGSSLDVARQLKSLMQNAQLHGLNFGVPA